MACGETWLHFLSLRSKKVTTLAEDRYVKIRDGVQWAETEPGMFLVRLRESGPRAILNSDAIQVLRWCLNGSKFQTLLARLESSYKPEVQSSFEPCLDELIRYLEVVGFIEVRSGPDFIPLLEDAQTGLRRLGAGDFGIGAVAFGCGCFAEAEEAFNRCVAQAPDTARFRFALALSQFMRARYQSALGSLVLIGGSTLALRRVRLLRRLATAFRRRGDLAFAKAAVGFAFSIAGEVPDSGGDWALLMYERAGILWIEGKRRPALRQMLGALRLGRSSGLSTGDQVAILQTLLGCLAQCGLRLRARKVLRATAGTLFGEKAFWAAAGSLLADSDSPESAGTAFTMALKLGYDDEPGLGSVERRARHCGLSDIAATCQSVKRALRDVGPDLRVSAKEVARP